MNLFEQMKEVRSKLPSLAPKIFNIRTKDRGIIPYNLSEAQKRLCLDPDIGSDIILKARQLGISTHTILEFLSYCLLIEGVNTVIVSEDREKTKRLLYIAHLALDMMPDQYKIPRDHAREDYIIFKAPPEGTGSSLYIGTAGQAHFGRGDTIHAAHCSELGLWPDAEELLNGLEEAVPLRDGAILRIESTAYGRGNHFHQLCERAMHKRGGRYNFRFFPWWFSLDDEYKIPLNENEIIIPTDEEKDLIENVNNQYNFILTSEHLKWRRTKIDQKGLDNFLQEYPEDPESCFLSTGNSVFYGIMKMLDKAAKRLRYAMPITEETIRGVVVKKWKLPKAGDIFILAVDTSEATKKSSDYDAISIWQVQESGTLEQAATGYGRVDSSSLTHAICELAEEYNNSMIVVERANKGYSIIDKLLDVKDKYNFEVYHHSEFDQEEGKLNEIPGWRATKSSKAAAIGRFEEMFKTGELIVHDPEILDQAMNYQYNANSGKAESPPGTFSDLLMTAMISCFASDSIQLEGTFGVIDIV